MFTLEHQENIQALVESGAVNIRQIISMNTSCIEFLEQSPGVTPEEYDAWRVEVLGAVPCLRTIRRKGLTEVLRICKATRADACEALEIVNPLGANQ